MRRVGPTGRPGESITLEVASAGLSSLRTLPRSSSSCSADKLYARAVPLCDIGHKTSEDGHKAQSSQCKHEGEHAKTQATCPNTPASITSRMQRGTVTRALLPTAPRLRTGDPRYRSWDVVVLKHRRNHKLNFPSSHALGANGGGGAQLAEVKSQADYNSTRCWAVRGGGRQINDNYCTV